MKHVKGNVLPKNKFQPRMAEVLNYVAESVAETLGPYGHNALIQTTDRVVSTKDGWNVLRNITFDNIVDNSMKSLIEAVAHSVVLRVGDGSTTSTYMANRILQLLNHHELITNTPIRVIEESLVNCVDEMEKAIRQDAVAITDENMAEMIYKVAMVSSNWNKEFSGMIRDIYINTHNPIIKVQNSGTDRTSVEYIQGYDLSGRLMSNQYINNFSESKCELNNPMIMTFNFKLTSKYFIPLLFISSMLGQQGKTLIVMAPDFDKAFIDQLTAQNITHIKNQQGLHNMIPVQFDNKFAIDRDCVEDFALLINTQLISDNDDDMKTFFDDVTTTMTKKAGEDEDPDQIREEKLKFMETAIKFLNQYCGTCEKASINDKGILVNGFDENDFIKAAIEKRKEAVRAEIDAKTKECDALTMLTDDIRMKRIRLGKLQCNMGVIKIGGFGDADLKAKKDSLEDTIRACEAAYRDGVTVGSSIAIARTISTIDTENMDEINRVAVDIFAASALAVFERIIRNKYPSGKIAINGNDANAMDIMNTCINQKIGFNIMTDDFDRDFNIINPVNVDIEVLRGCLKLVITAITSNQFIFKNYEGLDYLNDDRDEFPSVEEFVENRVNKR